MKSLFYSKSRKRQKPNTGLSDVTALRECSAIEEDLASKYSFKDQLDLI